LVLVAVTVLGEATRRLSATLTDLIFILPLVIPVRTLYSCGCHEGCLLDSSRFISLAGATRLALGAWRVKVSRPGCQAPI
jgi:hypothetical protein